MRKQCTATKLTHLSIMREMGFKSLQEYDTNRRTLSKDNLWVYARDQAYYRMCERNHIFPMRQRINTMIPRTH